MLQTFEAIRNDIDERLAAAATNRRSPMHTPVVATEVDARVMVLRDWAPGTRSLRFHTDARAPKAAAIGEGAPVGVLFYDREAKIQLRCRGSGRIEREGEAADKAWAASDNFARRCYLGEAPGTPSKEATSGLPPRFEGVEPSEEDLAPARANFAVLLVTIEEIDWFYLSNDGHRRALFTGEGAQWIAP